MTFVDVNDIISDRLRLILVGRESHVYLESHRIEQIHVGVDSIWNLFRQKFSHIDIVDAEERS